MLAGLHSQPIVEPCRFFAGTQAAGRASTTSSCRRRASTTSSCRRRVGVTSRYFYCQRPPPDSPRPTYPTGCKFIEADPAPRTTTRSARPGSSATRRTRPSARPRARRASGGRPTRRPRRRAPRRRRGRSAPSSSRSRRRARRSRAAAAAVTSTSPSLAANRRPWLASPKK